MDGTTTQQEWDSCALPSFSNAWPNKVGRDKRDHLHAVGVIAHSFSALEEGMLDLYRHHLSRLKVPFPVIENLYLPLNENEKRGIIKLVFEQCDGDPKVVALVKNMVSYFEWCSDTRNKIIHAEPYPALFGMKPEMLHLSKRLKRNDTKRGYLQLRLSELRSMADKINDGVRHCATIRIYLRLRDTPREAWTTTLRALNPVELPEALDVPPRLALSDTPADEPPNHIKKRRERPP